MEYTVWSILEQWGGPAAICLLVGIVTGNRLTMKFIVGPIKEKVDDLARQVKEEREARLKSESEHKEYLQSQIEDLKRQVAT